MPVKADDLSIGDFIYLDSPTLPDFLNRRWIEIESFTIHKNPKAHVPRMGKAMAAWTERTFKISDIVLHKRKAQVETEIPRIVSIQEMFRNKRDEWIKNLHKDKQVRMQDLAAEERLPDYDTVRKVILKNTQLVQETGYMRISRDVVEELASLFRGVK